MRQEAWKTKWERNSIPLRREAEEVIMNRSQSVSQVGVKVKRLYRTGLDREATTSALLNKSKRSTHENGSQIRAGSKSAAW
jgi:hypothetical protein